MDQIQKVNKKANLIEKSGGKKSPAQKDNTNQPSLNGITKD